nr:flagellar biosynthetic protein FliO [Pseudomarimonas arenosa]
MIFVVALILLLAWLIRRLPGIQMRGHSQLRVVASLSLGVRERVVVVEIGEQQWVLGVTAEQVALIDRLDPPLPSEPAADFSKVLARFGSKDKP